MVVDMKKSKDKSEGSEYVEVDGSREMGEPQSPGEDKILEKKWNQSRKKSKGISDSIRGVCAEGSFWG